MALKWQDRLETLVSETADTWHLKRMRLGWAPQFYLYHRESTATEWGALFMIHEGETPDPSWKLSDPQGFGPSLTRDHGRKRIREIAGRLPLLPVLPDVPLGPQPKAFAIEPAPRANPAGRLDAAWIVRRLCDGRIVARFDADGRDRAQAWIHAHTQPTGEGV
jgi:hypothetical protein